jgi:hypothetical protein
MESLFENIDTVARLYLEGAFATDTRETRRSFVIRYQTMAQLQLRWLNSLKPELRQVYQPLVFKTLSMEQHRRLLLSKPLNEARERRRKEDTDALMHVYAGIRSEAHLRWNLVNRIRLAYAKTMEGIGEKDKSYPKKFTFRDKDVQFYFRIWNTSSLIKRLSNPNCLNEQSKPPPHAHHLELTGATRLTDNHQFRPDEILWFIDLLRHCNRGKCDDKSMAWRKSWGYPRTGLNFFGKGILFHNDFFFQDRMTRELGVMIIPVEQIFYGLSFGLLAVDLITSTGARINEILQVSLGEQCLVRLIQPAPLGASNQSPRVRYVLRMIPKGERKDVRHDFFIGNETKRLLARTAQLLAEHYELHGSQRIPLVTFSRTHRRAHRFKPDTYIFQINHKHLSASAVTACVKFLLHGMVVRTNSGRAITIRPHLLRHGFATHAVQVEKIPIDIVGAWLHQKSIRVTEYYARPTETMVADATDRYLTSIANTVDIEGELLRSPKEIQEAYNEALSKTGTLAEVLGGHCASHGLCKVQFACVGCAAKIPDPAKRDQVLHRLKWAKDSITYFEQQGMLPEVRRLQNLIVAANTDLREMEAIEKYRADEVTPDGDQIFHVIKKSSVAKQHSSRKTKSHDSIGSKSNPRPKR